MKRKQHNIKQDILFILGSSLVVVIAWICFNLYHIWVTSTIEEKVQTQLEPIDGTFDTSVLQQLKARKQIAPLFTKQTTASSEATPVPTTTLMPTPIVSATPVTPSIPNASNSAPVIQPIKGQ